MTALTVPDVLRRAEQVLVERGWCRTAEQEADDKRLTVTEALGFVIHGSETELLHGTELDLYGRTRRFLLEHVGRSGHGWLTEWNDEQRSEAEVRAVLLAAAQRAEAGT